MYTSGAIAGGAAGVFAVTGFNALFLAELALLLVIAGALLLRAASLRRSTSFATESEMRDAQMYGD